MIINEHELKALYLRKYPGEIVVSDNGTEYWYSASADKYYWQNKNHKKRNGIYEARGLRDHWKRYQWKKEMEFMEYNERIEEEYMNPYLFSNYSSYDSNIDEEALPF